nr:hypothetical protein HK105_000870 [Polyrhizophydium stewartii]
MSLDSNATLETERLERLLFPWLAGAAPQLASTAAAAASASGRGIVITTGSKYALIARHSITTLRERGSVLPIEIVYCGDSDLGEPQRAMLAALPGVTAVDMKKLLPGLECAADWSSKPFAVLVSSFREVILMDADALFFQKPEVLFDMQGYRETGALFFRDRSLPYGLWGFGVGTSELLGQIAAPYLDRLLINSTQVAKWQVSHVFDSGVVVWDKQRAMPAILLTCLLNSEPFKETLYKKTLGDKESFWMAHEALRVPFKMAPGNGGAIGTGHQVGDVFRVCGVLFHPDEHGRPLWFNGGLFPRGSTEVQPVVAPEFVAIEYESRRAVWEYLGSQFCLRTRLGTAAEAVASGDAISYKLEGSDKAAAQRMVQLWTEISGDASVGGL